MRLRTSITSVVFTITALLASGVHANNTAGNTVALKPAVNAQKAIKLLAFGDSLTAGYQLPQKQAWPARLEARLRERGHSVEIVNAGVSGDTSGQGLRRVDWALKRGPYSVVFVGLGANDGLRNLPLKDLETNLAAVIDRFRAAGSRVVLLGMRLPTNQDAAYRKGFEELYPRLAKAKKVALFPFLLEGVAADEMLNLEDQIHPNAKGHEDIATNLLETVEPLLPAP